jgi:hypothetical protein
VTSDTSDIRGPIPLTRAGLQVIPVVSLMCVLCYLAACQCLAHAVP